MKEPNTRIRGRVLALAFLLAVVTYLDRICISAAAPYIMEDLHLSLLQMSVVFSAFTLACSLFEIPSGWLGDVKGHGSPCASAGARTASCSSARGSAACSRRPWLCCL